MRLIKSLSFLTLICICSFANAQLLPIATGASGSDLTLTYPAVLGSGATFQSGQIFTFQAPTSAYTSPANVKININTKGLVEIKNTAGGSLTAGDIKSNQIVTIVYDGAGFQMVTTSGNVGSGGGVTGSGTNGTITKWNASGTGITNSIITENGSNVGIGTALANYNLAVNPTSGSAFIGIKRPSNTDDAAISFIPAGTLSVANPKWVVGLYGEATANPNFYIASNGGTPKPRLTIDTAGFVGIRTSQPQATLHVVGKNDDATIIIQSSSIIPNGKVGFGIARSRGTVEIPTYVKDGDNLGGYNFISHDGTGFTDPTASIDANATQDHNIKLGTNLQFKTTANGQLTKELRMTIDHNGNIGIGSSTPLAALHLQTGALKFPDGTTQTTAASGSNPWSAITVNGIEYGNNVGIGTTATSADKLTISGTVKADGYKYTTAKTSYYSITPADFTTMDGRAFQASTGSIGGSGGTTSNELLAPVHLPHGAKITAVTINAFDNDASIDLSFYFTRTMSTGGISNPMFSPGIVKSSGSSASNIVLTPAIEDLNSVIDNSQYTYTIRAYPSSPPTAWTSNLKVVSIIIQYETTATQ